MPVTHAQRRVPRISSPTQAARLAGHKATPDVDEAAPSTGLRGKFADSLAGIRSHVPLHRGSSADKGAEEATAQPQLPRVGPGPC